MGSRGSFFWVPGGPPGSPHPGGGGPPKPGFRGSKTGVPGGPRGVVQKSCFFGSGSFFRFSGVRGVLFGKTPVFCQKWGVDRKSSIFLIPTVIGGSDHFFSLFRRIAIFWVGTPDLAKSCSRPRGTEKKCSRDPRGPPEKWKKWVPESEKTGPDLEQVC